MLFTAGRPRLTKNNGASFKKEKEHSRKTQRGRHKKKEIKNEACSCKGIYACVTESRRSKPDRTSQKDLPAEILSVGKVRLLGLYYTLR